MNGQWMGTYAGTNRGFIIVNLDLLKGYYEGFAYVQDSDKKLPCFAAKLRIPEKSKRFELALDSESFCPLDPRTGRFIPWQEITGQYPGAELPTGVEVKGEWDVNTLKLSWETNIATSGACKLKRNNLEKPTNLKSRIKTWDGLKKFVGKLEPRKYIFRGQNSNWRLRTGFHRTGRANLNRFVNIDIPTLLCHLSARTKHIFDLNRPEQNGAFYNLVQHHGYPTPLLDWTYSLFVAAFFAYRGIDSKQAVDPANRNKKVRIFVFDHAAWLADLPSVDNLDVGFPHFSIREFMAMGNERMIPQQGIASYTNIDDIEVYIEDCEKKMGRKYIQVIDLSWKDRDLVMRDLNMMGITAGSLFPGLDGACEELKERMF